MSTIEGLPYLSFSTPISLKNTPLLKPVPRALVTASLAANLFAYEDDFFNLPSLLRPTKGCYNLIDYEKAYCPEVDEKNNIFDLRGVDRSKGCVVIIRPDQYVSHIVPIDGYHAITSFFDRFMLARS